MPRTTVTFTPDPEQMVLWPSVSGNDINGLGEVQLRRPSPIYWHSPDLTPHGPLQNWFYARSAADPLMIQARAERQKVLEERMPEVASSAANLSAREWTDLVKQTAVEAGADLVGITRMRKEWVFEGYEVTQRWVVMLGVAQDFEQMKLAPNPQAAAEVVRQYARGNRIAKQVASAIRERGHDAEPHGGPLAGPMVLIPPAIECGFGELGKHGSIINRRFGSSFRLASVLTDVELLPDANDEFGTDRFCLNCRLCVDRCPPDAIKHTKQVVRGEMKWYVDFDKCLPYFNETMGCGICLAVCPWSRQDIATKLRNRFSPGQPM